MLKMTGDGRLVKDVVVKEVAGGKLVANATIANNRGGGDNKQTDFVDLIGWDNVALAMKDMKKGEMVNISGTFQMRSWTDKENKVHNNTEVVLDAICLANVKKKENNGNTDAAPASAPAPAKKTTTAKKAAPVQPQNDFEEVDEDELAGDLPF